MSEQCMDAMRCRPDDLRQAMSIHTRKITDSCRDKDCIEDLRVYLTSESQAILDENGNAKVRSVKLVYTKIDVEPVVFDCNHYCIDVTFFYQVLADSMVGCSKPVTLYGIAIFHKRAILCGEESPAHIYTSDMNLDGPNSPTLPQITCPTAVVEVLDPMVLGSKVCDVCHCHETCSTQIPQAIRCMFDDELIFSGDKKRLFISLGQFSIIRLERDAQLIVPVLDYSIPTKPCCENPGYPENPCEMFSRIPFPTQQFTPTGCDKKGDDPRCDCGEPRTEPHCPCQEEHPGSGYKCCK